MTIPVSSQDPVHVDEPQLAEGYANVLSQVARERRVVVVRRDGQDLAAVVPIAYLEELQDLVARQEAERISRDLDWQRLTGEARPAKQWFDQDEPKPF